MQVNSSSMWQSPFQVTQNFKNKNGCDELEMYFFYKYYNIAVSRFEWVNLPKEIEPFFIEDVMFWRGKGLMIKDPVINKYAFMRCNLTGLIDIYNIPEDRFAFASTGYFEEYGKDDSVILWDTPLTMPKFYTIKFYAKQMANLWQTKDINIYAQRTPLVVAMSQENRLSYENVINKYNQYIPTIKVDDYMNLDKLKVLKTEAPYLVDKLEHEMTVLESRLFTELGIENNPVEKKERLITDEVQGNSGATEMYRQSCLCTRERFCKQCNALWGLDISVRFRSELPTQLNLGVDYLEKEGENDVRLGNRSDRETNPGQSNNQD